MLPLLHALARRAGALALGLALAGAPAGARAQDPASAGGLAIDHEPPGCVVAGKYARLSACFRPPGAVARGRVYFRSRGTTDWFYVEMTGEPPCLEAVLPRPRRDLGVIEYAIAGVDRALAETRSVEYAVPVTPRDTCASGLAAPVVETAAVVIGSTSGTEPAGFLTGDGLRTGLILGVVGAAAAVAAVALLVRDGEEERPASTWRSELAVAGGRGQVVVDGAPAAGSGPGELVQSLPLRSGPHRLEAVLVEGSGGPGFWRFDLATLELVPGSLQVVAGEVERIGPDHVSFRLTGEPGERVALTFRLRGD